MSDTRDQHQRQEDEQKRRDQEVKWYKQADENLAAWYRKKTTEQGITYNFGTPKPPVLPDPGDEIKDGAALNRDPNAPQVSPDLVPYGIYDVTIEKDGKETTLKLNYSSQGIRPSKDTPEGWRAGIAFLAEKTLCDAVVLSVSSSPNFPEEAAKRLKMWAEQCIELGVAANLSGSSQEFLFGRQQSTIEKLKVRVAGDQYDKGEEIKRLISLSHFAQAEARVGVAHEWITDEANKIHTQTNDTKWDDLNRNALVDKPVEDGITLVSDMAKELESRWEKLEAIQNRLSELQQAEDMILKNPDAVVEVNERRKEGKVKTPEDALGLIQNTSSQQSELIAKLDAGFADLETKKDELKTKIKTIKNNCPPDDKDELGKGLDKLNVSDRLAKMDVAKLKTKQTQLREWNEPDKGRAKGLSEATAALNNKKLRM